MLFPVKLATSQISSEIRKYLFLRRKKIKVKDFLYCLKHVWWGFVSLILMMVVMVPRERV